MEKQIQKSSTSSGPTEIQAFKPIKEQRNESEIIAMGLVAKWIEIEKIILKAPEIAGRTESLEEVAIMEKLILRYGTFTPREIGDAIRKAAEEKARFLSQNPTAFPKLYIYDIEEQLQKMGIEAMKAKENPLQLASNTGGNAFFGEPSEALHREWPKIAAQVEKMRAIEPFKAWRDRFWYGGGKDQQESARGMLRQMFHEMNQADYTTREAINQAALTIFKIEYWTSFPEWRPLADGMTCPLKADEVEHLRKRTLGKIGGIIAAGFDSAPSIDNFPDPQDCTFCAIFDFYLEFKK